METLLLWLLVLASAGAFAAQVATRVRLIAAAPGSFDLRSPGARFRRVLVDVVAQRKTISERPLAGTAHAFVFWGFVAFGLYTVAEFLRGLGVVDLTLLDQAVTELVWKLANTMPGCLSKTIESVRKHKLEHWDRNKESNRAWLALNMTNEGRTGFRAFHEGSKECREPDFLLLRRRLAEGADWNEELIEEVIARCHDGAVAKG